jgi:hypothetical protein
MGIIKDFQYTSLALILDFAIKTVNIADTAQISEQTTNVLLVDDDACVDDTG